MRRTQNFSRPQTSQTWDLKSSRRGAVAMILVVAVTMIGTVLLTQGVRSVLNERRAMPAVFERQQAEHLLKTGVGKLKTLPSIDDVKSGSWTFDKGTLHPEQTGKLLVQVTDGSVTVLARYPMESDTPVSVSTTLTKDDWVGRSAIE